MWYKLGLQLGVRADDLEIIEKNYPRDADTCKIKMFAEWRRGDTNPTYEKLVTALSAVGKRKLAESVCSAQGKYVAKQSFHVVTQQYFFTFQLTPFSYL